MRASHSERVFAIAISQPSEWFLNFFLQAAFHGTLLMEPCILRPITPLTPYSSNTWKRCSESYKMKISFESIPSLSQTVFKNQVFLQKSKAYGIVHIWTGELLTSMATFLASWSWSFAARSVLRRALTMQRLLLFLKIGNFLFIRFSCFCNFQHLLCLLVLV